MTYRLAKMRALRKAGFVHVSGWVAQEDATEIKRKIEAAKAKVTEALKDDE